SCAHRARAARTCGEAVRTELALRGPAGKQCAQSSRCEDLRRSRAQRSRLAGARGKLCALLATAVGGLRLRFALASERPHRRVLDQVHDPLECPIVPEWPADVDDAAVLEVL